MLSFKTASTQHTTLTESANTDPAHLENSRLNWTRKEGNLETALKGSRCRDIPLARNARSNSLHKASTAAKHSHCLPNKLKIESVIIDHSVNNPPSERLVIGKVQTGSNEISRQTKICGSQIIHNVKGSEVYDSEGNPPASTRTPNNKCKVLAKKKSIFESSSKSITPGKISESCDNYLFKKGSTSSHRKDTRKAKQARSQSPSLVDQSLADDSRQGAACCEASKHEQAVRKESFLNFPKSQFSLFRHKKGPLGTSVNDSKRITERALEENEEAGVSVQVAPGIDSIVVKYSQNKHALKGVSPDYKEREFRNAPHKPVMMESQEKLRQVQSEEQNAKTANERTKKSSGMVYSDLSERNSRIEFQVTPKSSKKHIEEFGREEKDSAGEVSGRIEKGVRKTKTGRELFGHKHLAVKSLPRNNFANLPPKKGYSVSILGQRTSDDSLFAEAGKANPNRNLSVTQLVPKNKTLVPSTWQKQSQQPSFHAKTSPKPSYVAQLHSLTQPPHKSTRPNPKLKSKASLLNNASRNQGQHQPVQQMQLLRPKTTDKTSRYHKALLNSGVEPNRKRIQSLIKESQHIVKRDKSGVFGSQRTEPKSIASSKQLADEMRSGVPKADLMVRESKDGLRKPVEHSTAERILSNEQSYLMDQFHNNNLSKLKVSNLYQDKYEFEDEKSLNMKIQMLNGLNVEDEQRSPITKAPSKVSPLQKEQALFKVEESTEPLKTTSVDNCKGGYLTESMQSRKQSDPKTTTIAEGLFKKKASTVSTVPETANSQTNALVRTQDTRHPALAPHKMPKSNSFTKPRVQSVKKQSSTSIKRMIKDAQQNSHFNSSNPKSTDPRTSHLRNNSMQSHEKCLQSLNASKQNTSLKNQENSAMANNVNASANTHNSKLMFEASLRSPGLFCEKNEKELLHLKMDAQRKHFIEYDQAIFNNKVFNN